MAKSQSMKTENENAKPADTLADSTESKLVAALEPSASESSSNPTTATTPTASPKIWTSAELADFQQKAGLLAGALFDFQTKGGLVVVKNVEYEPGVYGVKLLLMASGSSIRLIQSQEGLDFQITATRQIVPSGSGAEVQE